MHRFTSLNQLNVLLELKYMENWHGKIYITIPTSQSFTFVILIYQLYMKRQLPIQLFEFQSHSFLSTSYNFVTQNCEWANVHRHNFHRNWKRVHVFPMENLHWRQIKLSISIICLFVWIFILSVSIANAISSSHDTHTFNTKQCAIENDFITCVTHISSPWWLRKCAFSWNSKQSTNENDKKERHSNYSRTTMNVQCTEGTIVCAEMWNGERNNGKCRPEYAKQAENWVQTRKIAKNGERDKKNCI